MAETSVGATIVRHIDELEAAVRYARTTMQPLLGKAVAAILERRKKSLGWMGDVEHDLDAEAWLAPPEWRTAADLDNRYDLYIAFDESPCMDRQETTTWVGTFCGFAGAGIRLALHSDALGPRDWKALLRAEKDIADQLFANGFLCDPKTGDLALLITMDRGLLAEAFVDEEFDEALAPIEVALDRVHSVRPLLDRLVTAIRKKAA